MKPGKPGFFYGKSTRIASQTLANLKGLPKEMKGLPKEITNYRQKKREQMLPFFH
jgi:hypothetical protein